MKFTCSFIASLVFLFGLSVTPVTSAAQPYFKDKIITLIVSWDPGGRIDRQARAVIKFLPKYIPGKPEFVIQNMPGGSGIPANQRFARGRPDGTVIMMETSRDLESAAFGLPGANFNPLKYTWIGAIDTGKQRNTLFTHKQAGFKTLEDLKTREVALGAQRVGHRSYLYGRLMQEVLGLKVRWVIGYSSPELYIAIERGEVDGRVGDPATTMLTRPDWIDQGLIIPYMAMTLPEKLPPMDHPLFAKVPSLMQFAKTEVQRDMIRKMNTTDRLSASLALPPGTPDHIRQTLEQAVLKLGKDPGFEREWETVVLRGTKFGGVYSTEEVVKAVRIYMEWKPGVLKTYRRLGFQPPK